MMSDVERPAGVTLREVDGKRSRVASTRLRAPVAELLEIAASRRGLTISALVGEYVRAGIVRDLAD